MPRSSPANSVPVPPTYTSAAGLDAGLLVSLQSSRNILSQQPALLRPKASRKPVPPIVPDPLAFSAEVNSHHRSSTPLSSQRQPGSPVPSISSQHKRAMSSPSPPHGLISRSPPVSAGQPTAGLSSAASVSLGRNTIVPPSLSRNNLSSNLPARAGSVSHNRPSLSSPSPPTPIVPSIPLRHATQHSPQQPTHTSPVPTAPQPPHSFPHVHTTYSRSSLDRHSPLKQLPLEHSPGLPSSANVSDPNLPLPISASAVPIEQPSYYALPLKQLLAKPAIPSQFQSGSSGGESDGGGGRSLTKPYLHAVHQCSTSTNDPVVQLIAPRQDSDTPIIEPAAVRTLQPCSPLTFSISPTTRGRENEGYHYRRIGEGMLKKERQGGSRPVEGSILWPDWRLDEGQERERKKNKVSDLPRSRNVLKRRPSDSTKPSSNTPRDPRSQSHSNGMGSRLSRSLSTSSLLKRARLFTSPSPDVHSTFHLPPKPSASDAPGRSVLRVDMHHMNDRASNSPISVQHHSPDSGLHMHTMAKQDSSLGVDAKLVFPTAGGSSASPVVAKHSSATLSSMIPSECPLTNSTTTTRLSTILSESSSTTGCRRSRDNVSKYLSPASALADAYRREQRAKEDAIAPASLVTIGPPLPPSPSSPSTTSDPPRLSRQSNPDLLTTNNINAVTTATSSNKYASLSSNGGGSGVLSCAEMLNNEADVAEKAGSPTGETNLVGPADTSQQQQQQQQTRASLSDAVKISVTKEKEDPISDSAHGLPLVQSPLPLPPSPPKSPPEQLSSPSNMSSSALHVQVHQSSSSLRLTSPLSQPPLSPLPASPRAMVKSSKLKKARHTSDQGEFSHRPYYTVVGTRGDQVFGVGGGRDSLGAGYSEMEKAMWGIQTTITAGAAVMDGRDGKDRNKTSIGRSLSRKLSGKFKREKSPDDTAAGRLACMWQDARIPLDSRSGPPTATDSPRDLYPTDKVVEDDDRCFPSVYSMKKQAQSDMDLSAGERDRDKEKDGGGSRMFPKLWRLLGGRSKSRERNEIESGQKTEKPPPLPALPKHYVNDIYTPIYSQQKQHEHKSSSLPRTSHKSHRSRSAKSSLTTPPGRPSTATTPTRSSTSDAPLASPFWNRSHSAGSSVTSLGEVPPMPSPLPDLRRYTTDETDPRSRSRVWKGTNPNNTAATHSPRAVHANTEEEPSKPHHANASVSADIERSDSPPIPLFSTAEPINSFPLRRSSERPKTSPASSTASSSAPSPISAPVSPLLSPPPRPARSAQRPKLVHSRTESFGDEALYPPVMKNNDISTRSIPKMTFREMDSRDSMKRKRQALTEQEKADRWDALLEKSEAAGGTLHFGGEDDKLPSDLLRFSRTLSELARDDESVSVSVI